MMERVGYIVIDVDGTMTDGGIYYDGTGNELKKFSVKDGPGLIAAHHVGIRLIVLTGRESSATIRRMEEMKVDVLLQNVKDKASVLKEFIRKNKLTKEEIAYIGDDLNDLESMELVGFVGCPADSCREVKDRADYISSIKGGHGAVRDIIEHILKKSGEWDIAVSEVFKFASV